MQFFLKDGELVVPLPEFFLGFPQVLAKEFLFLGGLHPDRPDLPVLLLQDPVRL